MRHGQLPGSLDPDALPAALPRMRHFFRYRLHDSDFHPLRRHGRLLGYYSAKPLYGRLDARGRVDRDGGPSGEIATVFVPSPARSWKHARLVPAHMPSSRVLRADGRRNWPEIRRAAERALLRELETPLPGA